MLSSQKRLITKFILKALLWGISRGLLISFNLHPTNTSLLIFLALHTLEKPAIWHFSPERTNLIPRGKILQETKITTHGWLVWLLWLVVQILPYDSLSTDKDSSSKVFGIMLLLGIFALTSATFSSFAFIKEPKRIFWPTLLTLSRLERILMFVRHVFRRNTALPGKSRYYPSCVWCTLIRADGLLGCLSINSTTCLAKDKGWKKIGRELYSLIWWQFAGQVRWEQVSVIESATISILSHTPLSSSCT